MAQCTKYDDIIDLPHHVSSHRAKMSMIGRAAQFAPFAALSGYGEMVKETERYVDTETELAADQQCIIDQALRDLADIIDSHPYVWLTYFEPDSRKTGGMYIDISGQVSEISRCNQTLTILGGPTILFEQLRAIHLQEGT